MKNKILSMLLSVTMLSSMAVTAVNADEAATVNDVYNITFNKGILSSGKSQPDENIRLAWVSGEGYNLGFGGVSSYISGTSWKLVDAPARAPKETDDKALYVQSSPSSNSNCYMEIKTLGFNSTYDAPADVLCGANGYTEFSFDFYNDFLTDIRLTIDRFWGEDEDTLIKHQNLLYVCTNGEIKLFDKVVKIDKKTYTNTWHNIKFVFKADGTYRAFLDNEPLIDWTALGGEAAGKKIGGVRAFRIYNICSESYTSKKYYDNLRYSFSTSAYVDQNTEVEPLVHSDNNVNRNFVVDEGYLFVAPDMAVAAFKEGLNREGDVLDADGNALANNATMANAATLKLSDTGETLTIVTTTNSVLDKTEDIAVEDNGGISGTEWSYLNTYYSDRGYKAEIVDAFAGKESGDKSLKITLENFTDKSISAAFLDFYPADDADTAYTEVNAPMTYVYSIYTHQEGHSGNSLQARFADSTYADGIFERDCWNRYAVTVYPNSKEYKLYVNGVLTDEGELDASVLDTEKKRFRFRFETETEGNYFVIDDVQTIYGVYEPKCDVALTENGADLTATAVTSSDNNADFVNTMIVIAEYNDKGILINVANDNGTATASELSCVLGNIQDKAKVKVFLWGMSELSPVIGAKTID